MKRLYISALFAMALVSTITAEENKVFYFVVAEVNCAKKTTYESATAEQVKDLTDAAKIDAANFAKALAITEKKWKEDKDLKTTPFPKQALAAPKVVVIDKSDSLEKANDKVDACKKRDEEMREAEEAKAAEKAKKKEKKSSSRKETRMDPERALDTALNMLESELLELKAKQQEALAPAN